MSKEKEIPKGYGLLWGIVLIIAIFVGITHLGFLIGQGRWECTEYKTYCKECEIEGTEILIKEDYELEIKWRTTNPNQCFCTEYTTKCVNEVWTRK